MNFIIGLNFMNFIRNNTKSKKSKMQISARIITNVLKVSINIHMIIN